MNQIGRINNRLVSWKKRLILTIFLLGTTAKGGDLLPQVPTDKKLHFLLSYSLTYTGASILREISVPYPELVSGVVVFSLGVVKELTDERGDKNDMLANSLGNGLAMGMHYSLRF